ncbi:MAG TPA: ATP-binding cassette domain-containing protein [Deltaproteobacteria bacterium]|jgi:ATP-binding cassette subfamily F protein uup|nr:ATP-binding cassette domain-containing protein [Deltaproteobacteria bacterium]HOI08000.1 ATP-binding cassette domain-containing protein [Deltaproteobacteria bacterium]
MAILSAHDISMSFGGPALLENVSLQIEEGERIGLLGRNGSGKSTLMRIIGGLVAPDGGRVVRDPRIKVAMLPQEVPDDVPGTVYDVVASGGAEHSEGLKEYHDLTVKLASSHDGTLLKRLEEVQHRLEAAGAWTWHQRIERVIRESSLDGDAPFGTLSAGMKRRAFLARALVNGPDILLLDEPTNHLDIDSILLLEETLARYGGTIVFVTHDREFLKRLSTRIVEIDRGRLLSFSCGYAAYLERRQAMLEAEEKERGDFDRKLEKEEAWIRQGVKARRTRNEGRVSALMKMREERMLRRDQAGLARIALQEAEKSGRLVADARKISFSYGGEELISNFSTTIMRGDKVGIIGPNGSGKTTLLKILLGELTPTQGTVRLGTRVRVAYFDQLRAQLDENRSVKDSVAEGSDQVFVNGSPRHITGYLKDFLFSREQISSPVRSLSGGERNRLLLARLFSMPSNVLVLDEPTNDLDAETLELLEARLVEFSGTILLVSHDRAFLNNVVTSTIAFLGKSRLLEFVGGYDDYLRQRPVASEPAGTARQEPRQKPARPAREKTRLSYKEARELEALPGVIEGLEREKEELAATLNSPEFQTLSDRGAITEASDRLDALEREIESAYRRWEELEDLSRRLGG